MSNFSTIGRGRYMHTKQSKYILCQKCQVTCP